jgi:GNAT superfamily N-acetyltransferase
MKTGEESGPGAEAAARADAETASPFRIGPVPEDGFEAFLPLIAAYQTFYGAEPHDERNRAYFHGFLAPSRAGLLIGAWDGEEPVGFTCLYFTGSSVIAHAIVLLSDLLVVESHRGRGIGAALIEAALDVARERGAAHVEWLTAIDNRRAQRLYERIPGAERYAWFGYEVQVGEGP